MEVAARITGEGAERVTALIYKAYREQGKTKGATRLTDMLRSGKPLKVYTIRDEDLKSFCQEAKKYGILYCVLKDRDASDGVTDIMVRADDSSKVARVFERYGLTNVHTSEININPQEYQEGITRGIIENPLSARSTKSRLCEPSLNIPSELPEGAPWQRKSVKAELKEITQQLEQAEILDLATSLQKESRSHEL